MPAIPPHDTAVVDKPWDAGANVGRIPNDAGAAVFRREFAWVNPDGDPDTKGAYSFPHHEVSSSGSPGAANIPGVRNALARLPQSNVPASDHAGVQRHLNNHLNAFKKQAASALLDKLGLVPGDLAAMTKDQLVEVLTEMPDALSPPWDSVEPAQADVDAMTDILDWISWPLEPEAPQAIERSRRSAPPRDNLVRALHGGVLFREAESGAEETLGVLYGTIVPYGEWAEIRSNVEGHFLERFAPGSLTKSINEQSGRFQVLYEHGLDPAIGRKVLGPIMSLTETDAGADYEVALLDTSYNRDLLPALRQGLLGSSMRFRVMKDDYLFRPRPSVVNPDGLPERTVREAAIMEFGPCPFPTYSGAGAGMRSRTDEYLALTLAHGEPRGVGVSVFIPDLEPEPVLLNQPDDEDAIRTAELMIADGDVLDGETRSEVTGAAYERLIRYVTESPWAIHESSLGIITSVLAARVAGDRATPEEIAELIGSRERDLDALNGAVSNGVAVLPIHGPIVPHGDLFSSSSGMASADGIGKAIDAAVASKDVHTIVLDMDTPGGNADLIPELATKIASARAKKPIIAVANTWAASAGYWLMSQASEAVVTPSGEVGSVGVITAHQDMSKQLKDRGIKITTVTAGKYKGERSPYAPLSDEAKADMQRKVDAIYQDFVSAVARGRGVSAETVEEDFGQGRLVMAADALAAGMVDRVATLEEVLAQLGASDAAPEPEPDALPSESDGAGAEPHSEAGAGAELHSFNAGSTPVHPISVTLDVPFLVPSLTSSTTNGQKETAMSDIARTPRTLEELAARQEEIRARLQEIQTEYPTGVLEPDLQAEWEALVEERDLVNKPAIQAAKMRLAQVAEYGQDPNNRVDAVPGDVRSFDFGESRFNTRSSRVPGDVYDLTAYRSMAQSIDELPGLYRDGAMRVLERSSFPHPRANREDAQTHVDRLLAQDSEGEIARRIIGTGSPAYDRAYGKALKGMPLTSDEMRQLASFTGSGGYAVPFTLDPTVILTSDGSINPLRAMARIITLTSGNTWKGVASAGITASYDAELTETSDDKPTLTQPEATVEKAQAFVPFSIEIDQDWPQMRGELASMFSDAKDTLEAEKFLTGAGHGSKEPQGLLVGTTYHISTTSSNTLTVPEDISLVTGGLAPRWASRASWLANVFFYNTIRAGDDTGTLYAPLTAAAPAMLFGQPAYIASEMAANLNDATALAIYGDFGRGFAIVDKVGLSTELIPHLFGTARNYPSGERGIYAYWRNTSVVLVDNAFRQLQVKT